MAAPAVSFRIKVTVLLGGIILLAGVAGVLYARNDMRRILTAELENRGQAIAKDLAANSVDALLTGDLLALYDLVNRTKLNNEDIRYILILTPTGSVRVNTFGEGIPTGLIEANVLPAGVTEQLRRIHTEEGLVRDVAAPILGGKAGTVRLGLLDHSVETAVARNARGLALLVLLAVGVGVPTSYWFAYYLTRPLSRLLDAVKSVTQGNLQQRIPSPGSDEVGQLGNAFNLMTDALAEKEAARRSLLEKVISSQEEERKRVARELHDELAQGLTSVQLSLETLQDKLGDTDDVGKAALGRAGRAVTGLLAETRKLIGDLRPTVLDDLGLIPAIRSYAEAHLLPIQCEVTVSASNMPQNLPSSTEIAVFRIVQEAINNIVKHAGASAASIVIAGHDGVLQGEISDDGKGFSPNAVKRSAGSVASGVGLQGMKERAALLGGTLSIWSQAGKGTRVSFSISLGGE